MLISATVAKRLILAPIAVAVLFIFSASTVGAIAKGYSSTDTNLQVGMVASLEGTSSNVVRASQQSADRVVGVVTTLSQSPLAVASSDSNVLVENSGTVSIYTTDMNGNIQAGDALVLSSIKGVVAKADSNQLSTMVARAAEDMSSATDDGNYQLSDGTTARVFKIKAELVIGNFIISTSDHQTGVFARFGSAIVGKPISSTRVLSAITLFVATMIIIGAVTYGAISNAMVALGRNPIARGSIHRAIVETTIIALIVLILGLAATYAILWI